MPSTTQPSVPSAPRPDSAARPPGRLFSLGENMIEILVEGPGEIPATLFERYLAEEDHRHGPKAEWRSGSLSAEVSAVLTDRQSSTAVKTGNELRVDDSGFQVFLRVAGDAYDVAVAAAALGTEAHLLSATGDCTASEFMRRWMAREGVELDHCPQAFGQQVAAHFLVRGKKRYSRWGSAAARLQPGDLQVDYGLLDVFHTFGGTTQMLSASLRAVALEQARAARAAGATLSYTLNDRPDLRESVGELRSAVQEMAPLAKLLFVGAEEASEVFGLGRAPSDSEESSAETARSIHKALKLTCPELRCLFVTDGRHGVHVFERGQRPRHLAATLASPQDLVEPIGAGDAFVGGTLHGVLHGLALRRAAEVGMVTAQLNTLGHGAVVPPDHATVKRHLKEHFHWPPQLVRRV